MATEQPTTLDQGGIAVIVLANGFDIPPDYARHAQLLPLRVAEMPNTLPALSTKLPANTKVVLVAGELPQFQFGLLQKLAARRSLPWIVRRNAPALNDALTHLLPAKPAVIVDADAERDAAREQRAREEAAHSNGNGNGNGADRKQQAPRGSIAKLIADHADLSRSPSEEARRLLTIAQTQGLPTTFQSIAQGITVAKRLAGRTGVPKSVMSADRRALITLDESIAGLQLMREWVESTEKELHELRAQVAKFRATFKSLAES